MTGKTDPVMEPKPQTPEPAPEPEPQEGFALPEDDPDVVALRAAEAELEAESAEAGAKKTAEPTPEEKAALPAGDPGTPGKAAAPGEPDPDEGEQVTIPKARFDEVRNRGRETQVALIRAEAERDTLQKLIDAGVVQPHQVPEGGVPTAQPVVQKTADERIQDIRGEQTTLAKDFEDGKIGAEAWETKRQGYDDQIWELRSSGLREGQDKAAPARGDLYLDEKTTEIETQYPILEHLTEEQLKPIAKIALAHLEFEGKPFVADNPTSVLEFRAKLAQMADQAYYLEGVHSPSRNPTAAPADPAAPGPAPDPAAQPTVPAEPGGVTEAQRRAKLELAARQPANLPTSPGHVGGGLDGMTEERFLAMTTEEVAALPAEVLDRIESQGL